MKAQSNIKPEQLFVVDNRGEVSDITFFENPKEITDGWEYDTYTLTVDSRDGLSELIESDLSVWLEFAKEKENPVITPPEPSDVDLLKGRLQQAEKLIDTMLGVD